mmetsp:Transcript_40234/g.124729  ORF Transcript_40234/g.124729 Transcript_40234/m.124729 type:complete len:224 (+) Transcript_40234:63-734(+)
MSDEISELLVLFLKCMLFTVLKARGLYPEESFRRQQALGHPCWWSTCAEVEDYVSALCESLRPAISRNRLQRLLVAVKEASGALRERYALEFLAAPQRLAGHSLEEIYHALGLALTKLEMSSAVLGAAARGGVAVEAGRAPPPPTWSVLVETRAPEVEEAPREEALGPRWDATAARREASAGPPGMVLHPLKSIVGGGGAAGQPPPVVLNLYVEDASGALRPY